jgi:hypothetical protein
MVYCRVGHLDSLRVPCETPLQLIFRVHFESHPSDLILLSWGCRLLKAVVNFAGHPNYFLPLVGCRRDATALVARHAL